MGFHLTALVFLQVTDTTTFTAEERRAEVDAWLYETCTQCLQHMVDIVALFYKPVAPILPRIFDLLSNFIRCLPFMVRWWIFPEEMLLGGHTRFRGGPALRADVQPAGRRRQERLQSLCMPLSAEETCALRSYLPSKRPQFISRC